MGTSVSSAAMARIRTVAAAAAAFLLALGLAPMAFAAEDSVSTGNVQVDSVAAPLAGPGYEGDARSASPNSGLSVGNNEGLTLASALAGSAGSIVSADVALDASDPIVGSFTVDGLTYALNDGKATLISVGATFVVAPYEGSADSGDGSAIAVPASVTYDGTTYSVTAVGPYAFYLSGAASIELPDSIASVDCRAFRSSDVERVEVDPDNPNLTSFDGCLYDSQLTSLLLIPEGRAGSVPIPSEAEVVEASKFSHCSLADAISVDGDGADFASWDGLLYSADGTTLLRVPAGATEITIRDGCTAIAVGAMEGCAKLERINAPASVTSISPDVFESVPTISLPIASALQDDSQDDSVAGPLAGPGYEGDAHSASAGSPAEGEPADSAQDEGEAEVSPRRVVASSQGLEAPLALPDLGSTSASPSSEASGAAPQLAAMVALSSADDDLPEVDPSSIEVLLPEGADAALWERLGFACAVAPAALSAQGVEDAPEVAGASQATTFRYTAADWRIMYVIYPEGGGSEYTAKTGVRQHTEENEWLYVGGGTCNYAFSFASGSLIARVQLWSGGTSYIYFGTNSTYSGVTSVEYTTDFQNYTALPADANYHSIPNIPGANGYGYVYFLALDGARENYHATWDANGGTVKDASGAMVPVYDEAKGGCGAISRYPSFTVPTPSRPGYRFLGWASSSDGSGGYVQPGATFTLKADAAYYAQWSPTISADVPLEVTARVDLLGIEEQAPASGYIESRCGEPLKVAEVAMEPLSGATDLFGAGNEAQVWLHAHANGAPDPFASFALDGAGTESDPAALAPLTMASYGTRVPVGYRFDIPDALLSSLAEATLPVCQVSYTVALA